MSTNKPTEAYVLHKFNIRLSKQTRALVLHLEVNEELQFDFALSEEAAKNLLAGLDKGLIQLEELGSSSTH